MDNHEVGSSVASSSNCTDILRFKSNENTTMKVVVASEQESLHQNNNHHHQFEAVNECCLANMSRMKNSIEQLILQERLDRQNELKKLSGKYDSLQEKFLELQSSSKKSELTLKEEIQVVKKKVDFVEKSYVDSTVKTIDELVKIQLDVKRLKKEIVVINRKFNREKKVARKWFRYAGKTRTLLQRQIRKQGNEKMNLKKEMDDIKDALRREIEAAKEEIETVKKNVIQVPVQPSEAGPSATATDLLTHTPPVAANSDDGLSNSNHYALNLIPTVSTTLSAQESQPSTCSSLSVIPPPTTSSMRASPAANNIKKKVTFAPIDKKEKRQPGWGKRHGVDKSNHSTCVCGLQFSRKNLLRKHIQYYTIEWKFECKKCEKRFVAVSLLNKHRESIHGISSLKRKFGCSYCGALFSSGSLRAKHSAQCQSKRDFNLIRKQKGRRAALPSSAAYPRKVHVKAKTLKNPQPKERTNSKTIVRKKSIQKSSSPSSSSSSSGNTSSGSTSTSKRVRNLCKICQQPFATLQLMIDHWKTEHKENKNANKQAHGFYYEVTNEVAGNRFFCRCRKDFDSKLKLFQHIRYATAAFRCTFCSKKFKLYSGLQKHMESVHKK